MDTEEYYGGTYPSPDKYENEEDSSDDEGYDEDYYMDRYFEEKYEFDSSDFVQVSEEE